MATCPWSKLSCFVNSGLSVWIRQSGEGLWLVEASARRSEVRILFSSVVVTIEPADEAVPLRGTNKWKAQKAGESHRPGADNSSIGPGREYSCSGIFDILGYQYN
jgi:hypothetical protein